jgi:replicative DNA helicase
MTTEMLPPFNMSAEEAVVASLMVDAGAADRIVGLVRERDFYRDENRFAFTACLELWRRGEAVNQVTVADELRRMNELDQRSLVYLSRIVGDLPTPIGVEHYANLVHKDAVYRATISVGTEIVRVAYTAPADLTGTLARMEKLLQDVIQDRDETNAAQTMAELVQRFWTQPGPESREEGAVPRSGFVDLDGLLGGFRGGALTTVAAKTGIGKSALLLNIARNMAVAQQVRTLIVSLEMSGDEWFVRLLAHESGIDSRRLRLGNMNEAEERRALAASGDVEMFPISIDDRAYMAVEQIRAAARRKAAQEGLGCLMVDYLQLAAGGRNRDNRVQEVTDISRGLKRLARDLNIPVIAAAQLSRAIDYRKGADALPRLSDLRESGSIEQDSDVVVFLHRKADETDGMVKVIVAKNRGGPIGSCHLRMRPETATFEDLQVIEEPSRNGHESYQEPAPWAR